VCVCVTLDVIANMSSYGLAEFPGLCLPHQCWKIHFWGTVPGKHTASPNSRGITICSFICGLNDWGMEVLQYS